MSEEADCDDLPLVTVNTSANNSSTFAMPSAEQLAEQRARDEEYEHKLEMLRQRARASEHMALGSSDAGASEGELTLAAAVTALNVRAERPRADQAASAAELWAALAPHLPPQAAALQSCLSLPAPQPRAALTRAVSAVAESLAAPGPWPDDELQCAAALLSVGVLARESRCRRVAARALHALLDCHASPDQVFALVDVLLAALPAARARLLLSDALRSGAAAGSDLAAAALTSATALQLLRADRGADTAALDTGAGVDHGADTAAMDTGVRAECGADTAAMDTGARAGLGTDTAAMDTEVRAECGADTTTLDTGPRAGHGADSAALDTVPRAGRGADSAALDTGALESVARAAGAWRSCDAPSRYMCVQLAGRLLAAADGSATPTAAVRERLLAHLALPPAADGAHRTDRLKAMVGVSTLKLLFSAKNSVSDKA